jgi:hypothetical protein
VTVELIELTSFLGVLGVFIESPIFIAKAKDIFAQAYVPARLSGGMDM